MSVNLSNFLLPDNAIDIYSGQTKTMVLTIATRDSEGTTTAYNLENSTVIFTMKAHVSDREALLRKTSADASQIELTNPRGGEAAIKFETADTSHLDEGDYVFDVWVRTASGDHILVVKPSTIRVIYSATRF